MDMYGYSGVFLVKRFLDKNNSPLEVTNMSDINKANPHGCDNGALTDRFGVLIQGLLAIVAFSTLMCELAVVVVVAATENKFHCHHVLFAIIADDGDDDGKNTTCIINVGFLKRGCEVHVAFC